MMKEKAGKRKPVRKIASTPPAVSAPQWSYGGGKTGPEHWWKIHKDYESCASGKNQSPINIDPDASRASNLLPIQFAYNDSKIVLKNSGHTLSLEYDSGSSIRLNGKTFSLEEIHFHEPSEHQIDEDHLDMEMHLVHKSKDGEIAYLAVLIKEGRRHWLVEKFWNSKGVAHPHPGDYVNAYSLLPKNKSYFAYTGSLTTPPCTEGVHWIVFTAPITISEEQVIAFRKLHHDNRRPIQELNGRGIASTERN